MRHTSKSRTAEVGTSSMADIAFLLLSFFLMTTVIETDQGLPLKLPEYRETVIDFPVHEKNLFKIQINSNDEVLVEGERLAVMTGLRSRIKEFVMNSGENKNSSDNPANAIVSFKTDRGTSHKKFVEILDEIQGAYYEIYAKRAGLDVDKYRKLNPENPVEKSIIDRAKENIPMNISLAEPTSAN